MTTLAMTVRQAELLAFIRRHLEERGVSPSYDEMTAALGIRSKSVAHRLICGLEQRGAIRRLYGRARSIEIVEWTERSRGVRDGLLKAKDILVRSGGILNAVEALDRAIAEAPEGGPT